MGAQAFIHIIEGVNAKECFDRLVADATRCYGNESYSGTINTCSMGRCRKKIDKYTKKNEEKVLKEIETVYDFGEKWVADYIDLGVTKYAVTTAKKSNKEYTAKYKQQFVVCKNGAATNYHYDTKPLADKKAMELVLTNGNAEISVKKTMVSLKGNDTVSNFTVETKEYAKRPKLKPLPNRKVEEIHKYVFFGWASC